MVVNISQISLRREVIISQNTVKNAIGMQLARDSTHPSGDKHASPAEGSTVYYYQLAFVVLLMR